MSVAAIAPHAPPPTSYRSHHQHMDPPAATGSPSAQRKQHSKAPRPRQNPPNPQHNAGAQSDSNLPATTPRSKKQRNRQPVDRSASGGEAHTQPRAARPLPTGSQSPARLATPMKAAYAGPTFHQSPAPSSLPVPKFFSKSVPAPGPDVGFQARLDKETSVPTPPSPAESATPNPPLSRERSPLDIFFDKDREEKSKRPGSSALRDVQNADALDQSHLPIHQENSPFMQNRKISPPDTAKGLFDLELDPSQSPVVDQSARPSPAPRIASAPNRMPTQNQHETDRATHDLKALLFQSAGLTTPQRPQPQDQDPSLLYGNRNLSPMFQAARNPSPSHHPHMQQGWHPQEQSPFLTRNNPSAFSPGPPQHNHNYYNQHGGVPLAQPPRPAESSDVRDMEAKLRGILKLGP
ncbi:hypothetical protein MBLNU459_g5310t1 [Dothideomycetes sp. NU459]